MNATSTQAAAAPVLRFLRALERAQQDIRFDDPGAARRALSGQAGNALAEAEAALGDGDGPGAGVLRQALVLLRDAEAAFLTPRPWPDYAAAFLHSRHQQCEALALIYQHLESLPGLAPYFRLDGTPVGGPGSGLEHLAAGRGRAACSLYLPEREAPASGWPLVVCLHGSHGRGSEYLWTWLRAGRSRGYAVLAPKSLGATWSMADPRIDTERVLAAMDAIAAARPVDGARVLLTGLSDGGTFGYLLALGAPDRFRALAPIAGVLPPALEPALRAGRGRDLPLHVVHGAHDAIFPVHTARTATALLARLGYDVTYTELDDWGHALTNDINETLLAPWFDAIS